MQYRVTVNGKPYDVTVELTGGAAPMARGPVAAAPAPRPAPAQVTPVAAAPAPAPTPAPAPVAAGEGEKVLSPLPGNIWEVSVTVGQQVKANQCLIILEAMKMENEIVSPRDGIVKQILVKKGDAVDTDHVLVVLG